MEVVTPVGWNTIECSSTWPSTSIRMTSLNACGLASTVLERLNETSS